MDDSPASITSQGAQHPARYGHARPGAADASIAPIYLTAAFDVPDLNVLEQMNDGTVPGYIYTRDANPGHDALAESIAFLEGAEAGAVFSSGMGAIAAVFLSHLRAGDHLLAARNIYGKTHELISELESRYGIQVTHFDPLRPEEAGRCRQDNTRLCFVETVSNPMLEITPLRKLVNAISGVPLAVDATFTTSELIRVLDHGADLVVHSASKYLNGHGDVMLGVAAGSKTAIGAVRRTSSTFGQNPSPFNCWLVQRGLKTLPLRMAQIVETVTTLVPALSEFHQISEVVHPLNPQHPSHKEMSELYPGGCGGIISLRLKRDTAEAANHVFQQLQHIIPFSPTLADPRTTLSHPWTTSHRFLKEDERRAIGISPGLLRLSVGLEPANLLLQNLGDVLN